MKMFIPILCIPLASYSAEAANKADCLRELASSKEIPKMPSLLKKAVPELKSGFSFKNFQFDIEITEKIQNSGKSKVELKIKELSNQENSSQSPPAQVQETWSINEDSTLKQKGGQKDLQADGLEKFLADIFAKLFNAIRAPKKSAESTQGVAEEEALAKHIQKTLENCSKSFGGLKSELIEKGIELPKQGDMSGFNPKSPSISN